MNLRPENLTGRFVRLEPVAAEHKDGLRRALDCDPDTPGPILTQTARRFRAGGGRRHARAGGRDAASPLQCEALPAARSWARHSYLTIRPAPRRGGDRLTFYRMDARAGTTNPECKRLLLGNAFDAGRFAWSCAWTPATCADGGLRQSWAPCARGAAQAQGHLDRAPARHGDLFYPGRGMAQGASRSGRSLGLKPIASLCPQYLCARGAGACAGLSRSLRAKRRQRPGSSPMYSRFLGDRADQRILVTMTKTFLTRGVAVGALLVVAAGATAAQAAPEEAPPPRSPRRHGCAEPALAPPKFRNCGAKSPS